MAQSATASKKVKVFPRYQISGTPYECGKAYGEQARQKIEVSIQKYRAVFIFYADWDWNKVLKYAEGFIAPIKEFDPEINEELQGIADGAGVNFLDILAINTRTEIMFAAKARDKSMKLPESLECSSFAVTSDPQNILIGENWDWLSHCEDTVIILEASPLNQPKYVTVVEAGLLAKFGMNSQGLGIATNALISSLDKGEPGVPYHVLLRSLLKAGNTIEGIVLINKGFRSSSANYLLADKQGTLIDVEAMTGEWKEVGYIMPNSDHALIHTNHFITDRFVEFDITPGWIPSTLFRYHRIKNAISMPTDLANPKFWKETLCSHINLPYGVCSHHGPNDREEERFSTITSAIMNLSDQTIELTAGRPCESKYVKLDYADFFS
jgi:isopenicillin-N N-acyltransferase-like protein